MLTVCSTHLQEGINPAQGVFIEMFVTSYLVLAVLMLAVEKHHVTPFAPVSLLYQRVAWPMTTLARLGLGLLSSYVNCANLMHFTPWPRLTSLY